MNIFVVDDHPGDAARSLCDKHVVKMTVETAQILCTALYLRGVYHKDFYKPTHVHHPCVSWTSETVENFAWTAYHGLSLAFEYQARYQKEHKSQRVISIAVNEMEKVWKSQVILTDWENHTPFVQCMPEQYRRLDAIQAYRAFYKAEKAKFAKWKLGNVPNWWNS